MSNKFDTAELNDIRRLLGEDVPTPKKSQAKEAESAPAPQAQNNNSGGRTFNLDDILAEVSGVVDEANAEHAAKVSQQGNPAPRQPAAAPQKAVPKSGGMQQRGDPAAAPGHPAAAGSRARSPGCCAAAGSTVPRRAGGQSGAPRARRGRG